MNVRAKREEIADRRPECVKRGNWIRAMKKGAPAAICKDPICNNELRWQ